ncbi:MAG TPA: hypothetical protein VMG37_23905, partial [Solirubrobacteraceae bacterium]|nr:hypothetical protein [Solirubrobacteraceae bacterium]
MPVVKLLVVQAAVRVLPLPVRETAPQLTSELLPSLKLTVPVGPVPLTVAVKVTVAPAVEGLTELASVVVVAEAPPLVTLTVTALALALVTMMFTPVVLSRKLCPATSAESPKPPLDAGVMSTSSVSSAPEA